MNNNKLLKKVNIPNGGFPPLKIKKVADKNNFIISELVNKPKFEIKENKEIKEINSL